MSTPLHMTRVKRQIARFVRANDGSILPMFGFSLLLLMSLVGAAVDYARVNNARTAMQGALDSAALMISKDAAMANPPMSAADIQTKALAYFKTLYTNSYAPNVSFTATYTPATAGTAATVKLTTSGSMPTEIMKVAGFNKIDFDVASTATWGNSRMRVALALDNTGSMQQSGKMDALKKAAGDMITKLSASNNTDGDVYISIIPFAKDVNVGASNYNKTWVRWDLWDNANSTWSCSGWNCGWKPADHSTWNGCVTDRDQSYDTTADAPSSNPTYFPAEQYSDCPVEMMPLSNNWSALQTKITKMQPNGNTNQSIGMAWAWLSLLQQAPLNAPPKDARYQYVDAVVLLSDGDNTQNRFSSNQTTIDARQKLLCDNAKSSGIKIFTIQVGPASSNVLQNCASPGSYFPSPTADGIGSAFSAITESLTKLRIAY